MAMAGIRSHYLPGRAADDTGKPVGSGKDRRSKTLPDFPEDNLSAPYAFRDNPHVPESDGRTEAL